MRIAFALLALLPVPAHADQFVYRCKAKGKPSIVKVDDASKTLVWQGKTYKLARELKDDECGNLGWRLEGNGASGDFCTATQGVASFGVGKTNLDCELKR